MLRHPWLDQKILVLIAALSVSTLDLGGRGGSFDKGSGSLKCSGNVAVVLWTYFFRQPFALLVLSFAISNVGNVILNQICINAGAAGARHLREPKGTSASKSSGFFLGVLIAVYAILPYGKKLLHACVLRRRDGARPRKRPGHSM